MSKITDSKTLRKFKEKHGLTNTDIADKLGLSVSNYKNETVSKMLNGRWDGDWEWVSFKLNK